MTNQKYWQYTLYGLILWLTGSCVDPYNPPQIQASNRYLVVDGYLNGSVGGSTIKLSRTQNIGDFSPPTPESKATIRVESNGSTAYSFQESATGTYTLAAANLPFGSHYQVRIKTTDGNEYLSDPITIKQTPKIDSLTWAVVNSGLQVYVNTHDPANTTRYYRWEYEDTYEILTPYQSPFEYRNNQVVTRTDNTINHCWRTQSSTAILLGSTARLTQDILQKAPLFFIPGSSPKLRIKYSLLVKQYAQSPEAYAYWENLQKSTEQLGSLFDPLPSQVVGNIHNVTKPADPVLGFLDGFSVEQTRIFIDRPAALPRNQIVTGYESCPLDTIPYPMQPLQPLSAFVGPGGGYDIIESIGNGQYLGTAVNCADCRALGTTTKPSYWP